MGARQRLQKRQLTMKIRNIILTLYAIFTVACAQATTHEVVISKVKGNLTTFLRNVFACTTPADLVVVNFDKPGTYTIEGTIECVSNIEIKGTNRKNTTIVFCKVDNDKNFTSFTDDAFIKCSGTRKRPIAVSIHDVSIKLKPHKGIWWTEGEKIGIKIYHAQKVDVKRIDYYADNAKFTNIDMRVCSNVTVKDCNITNYNNCSVGGNLWIRGKTHNVSITDNVFRKNGNDEILAFFEATTDAINGQQGLVTRDNITVAENEFCYEWDKNSDKKMVNDVLITLFSTISDKMDKPNGCYNSNFTFKSNTIKTSAPFRTLLSLTFTKFDTHKNITVADNVIVHDNCHTTTRHYCTSFKITDESRSSSDTIKLTDNTITNHDPVVNEWGTTGYTFFMLQGGSVNLSNNTVHNDALTSSQTSEVIGTNLIWCGEKGGEVEMASNTCTGLRLLATVSEGKGIDKFTLSAHNNHFEGDTRIYCNNVRHFDVNFTDNVLISSNYDFFLQEFAKDGSIVFCGNDVTAKSGGQLMTHWTDTPLSDIKFSTIEVSNNIFRGVDQSKVFQNLLHCKRKAIRNNIYTGR